MSISLQWKDELSYSTKCLLLCSTEEILIQSFHFGGNYVLLQNSSSSVIKFILTIANAAIELFSSSFFIVKSFNLCLQGHSSYITHLDWSPDNKFIMSNSGDYEILYCKWLTAASSLFGSGSLKNIHFRSYWVFCLFGWAQSTMAVLLKCCVFLTCCFPSSTGDIPNGCKLIRNRSECKDIDWASYTCVLGFHVFGQYLWSDALWDFVP